MTVEAKPVVSRKVIVGAAIAAASVLVGVYAYRRMTAGSRKTSTKGGKKQRPVGKLPVEETSDRIKAEGSGKTGEKENVRPENAAGLGAKPADAQGTKPVVAGEAADAAKGMVGANDLSKLTTEKLLEEAQKLRVRGNKYFNSGKIDKAMECYTEAIRFYPEGHEEAALAYSNRAACHIKKASSKG